MNSKKFLLMLLIIIELSLLGCENQSTAPENVRSYNFIIQTTSSYIHGAVVSIKTRQQNYTTTTNNKGKCEISISNEVLLPEFLIVTVDHSSIKPHAISVPGEKNSNSNKTINCESAPSRVLVREARLHHLGDDSYTGSENSQLQIATEGVELSFSFYLSSIPNSMPYIRIFARGVQHPTEIKINGITTDRLNNSNVNGDLSFYKGQLTASPSTVFKKGTNIFSIKTFYRSSFYDWDDIEFCGLLLYYP